MQCKYVQGKCSSTHTVRKTQNIKGMKRLGCGKSGYFTWKVWREKVVVFLHDRVPREKKRRDGRLKEIHLHQDSRSSNLVILEALGKYGVKTGDILPPKKECSGEDSDWRESLTFKQALYPYRVGEDMHNPSKMHMNFPSSNSSRLNSSQWINYEYCMYWIAVDQIEFTVKKQNKKTNLGNQNIIFWDGVKKCKE